MFKKAVIRSIRKGVHIDVGLLAETLLFYQNVDLILDLGSAIDLIRQIGVDALIYIQRRRLAKITYFPFLFGFLEVPNGGVKLSGYGLIGDDAKSQQGMFITRLVHTGFNKSDATYICRRFFDSIPLEKFSIGGERVDFAGIAIQDLKDKLSFNQMFKEIVKINFPAQSIPDDWRVHVEMHESGGFSLVHNYDFGTLNRIAGRSSEAQFGLSNIMAEIGDCRADTIFSATHKGDLVVDSIRSRALCIKFLSIMSRVTHHKTEINVFQQKVFEGRSIADKVNLDVGSFKEFLLIAEKSRKFKKFMEEIPSDHSLLGEYIKLIQEPKWFERLPVKLFRFTVFTGVGSLISGASPASIAAAGGTVISGIDTFIVDSLLKGWCPSHFVQDSLSTFIGSE